MYRFFVDEKEQNKFLLSKSILEHIKVVRIREGEKFYCIYKSEYYLCRLENNYALILEKTNINNEFRGDVVLFASIINIKRFEWLIQKSTELGVKKIFPIITEFTTKKNIEIFKNKIKRFQEISKNASEQSFRNICVEIFDPLSFQDAIKYKIKNKYLAHEKSDYITNNNLFHSDVAFYVGPEGGFSEKEVNLALNNNIKIISLGKRILRAETASIFLLSRILD